MYAGANLDQLRKLHLMSEATASGKVDMTFLIPSSTKTRA